MTASMDLSLTSLFRISIAIVRSPAARIVSQRNAEKIYEPNHYIITVSEKGDREEQVIMTNEALRQLLRGVRDQALQEAIDVCDMWRKEVDRDYKGEKKQ